MGNPNPDFNMKNFWFLCHSVKREYKNLEAQNPNHHSFKGVKWGFRVFLMLIYTEKDIHSDDWVELPIYDDVVKGVE